MRVGLDWGFCRWLRSPLSRPFFPHSFGEQLIQRPSLGVSLSMELCTASCALLDSKGKRTSCYSYPEVASRKVT
ncbi:uncharacterized protein LACBIDRAFT_313761 [Laccaria bicolor S238N-H82]|uniref:Predicted protein n=1 Tax=Laccaria bicolor (strain S238N-H82 / ATCC MYA-4686) TaxID=486041 RepID=B0D0S4_LACBS|nr:uncharacterized protein LACBIDRAFT_313761 [Laccaria bicolor S238N-H82]EDR11513.1 predicted protein [Laccaria bicolor S238N-H82]|eukprot:XP_001877410.1 predicted protein [Laccaria bicolor S238N-H82]